MLSNSFCQGKFYLSLIFLIKIAPQLTGAKFVPLKLVCLPSENTALSVKPKQLNPVSDLAEGCRDEWITEMAAVTIVKFHDSPILQLPHCSFYQ